MDLLFNCSTSFYNQPFIVIFNNFLFLYVIFLLNQLVLHTINIKIHIYLESDSVFDICFWPEDHSPS